MTTSILTIMQDILQNRYELLKTKVRELNFCTGVTERVLTSQDVELAYFYLTQAVKKFNEIFGRRILLI